MPHIRGGLCVALSVAALAVLTACGDDGPTPVAVSVPAPAADVATICRAIAAALPKKVDDSGRRPTDPASDLTAAWGEPAVVMRCGVARPKTLKETSQLTTVNGVDWLVEDRDGGHVFTSVNRAVFIELVVPAAHDPQVGPLVDIAPAMQYVPVLPSFEPNLGPTP